MQTSSINTEFISLAELVRHHSQAYERMPVPIQTALRRSVWLTLITEVVSLLILTIVPQDFWLNTVQGGGFFVFQFMADITNGLLHFTHALLPWLLILNITNLFLTMVVLTISFAMLIPAKEPIHWLAAANAVPAVFNAFITGGTAVILVTVIVVNIIIWIIIIGVCLVVFGVILGSIH